MVLPRKMLVGLALGSSAFLASAARGQEGEATAPITNPPRVQIPPAPSTQAQGVKAPTGTPRKAAPQGPIAGAPRQGAMPPPSAALHQAQPGKAPSSKPQQQPGMRAAGATTAPATRVQQAQHQQPLPGPGQTQPGRQQPPAGPQPGPALSAAEQAELDQVLTAWEQKSESINVLTTTFTMFEYDAVFGPKAAPGEPPKEKRKCEGTIQFAAPDKGSYQMTKGGEERWMCDGKAIYEFDVKQKKLKEYRLPKELQGKAIANGPLPFVFGAQADAMKQRYVMRIFTPPEEKTQIWIEAWPRWQQDAANFHHVQVILDSKTMLPVALRLFDPNPQIHKVYVFEGTKVNGTWDQIKGFFSRPTTPLGWQHVVEEAPAAVTPSAQLPQAPTADARAKAAPPRAPAVK